jgi:hypothetical protein
MQYWNAICIFTYKTNLMPLHLLSKRITITATLLIWIIKFAIRPYFYFPKPLEFFFNIAPNLLGAFALVFGAFWLLEKYFFILQSQLNIKIVCFSFFIALVCNEYLQLIPFFGRTFDWYDIVASAVGLGISYPIFSKQYNAYLKTVQYA